MLGTQRPLGPGLLWILAASQGRPACRYEGVVCEVSQRVMSKGEEILEQGEKGGRNRNFTAAFHAWGQLKRSINPNILW